MTKKRLKRVLALAMALVLTVGAVLPTAAYVSATGSDKNVLAGSPEEEADGSENGPAEAEQEPVLYNETGRPDLKPAEIVMAEDIIVAAGYGFDVEQSFDGISYDDKSVKVNYYAGQGFFDGNKPGDYSAYYKAEPVSGKTPYLIRRTISVREPEMAVEESRESGDGKRKQGKMMVATGRKNLTPKRGKGRQPHRTGGRSRKKLLRKRLAERLCCRRGNLRLLAQGRP